VLLSKSLINNKFTLLLLFFFFFLFSPSLSSPPSHMTLLSLKDGSMDKKCLDNFFYLTNLFFSVSASRSYLIYKFFDVVSTTMMSYRRKYFLYKMDLITDYLLTVFSVIFSTGNSSVTYKSSTQP
jgi:hypothetical protein